MRHGLGGWLRAAGYNTVILARGLSDRAIAARCVDEPSDQLVPPRGSAH